MATPGAPNATGSGALDVGELARDLEDFGRLNEGSQVGEVRSAVTKLCVYQTRLLGAIRENAGGTPASSTGHPQRLERVVEAIGRLMDLASTLAGRQQHARQQTQGPVVPMVPPSRPPPTAGSGSSLGRQTTADLKASFMEGPPEIDPEEIHFDPVHDLIGTGAFGKVYRGMCRGKQVAVKVPNKQRLTESELVAFRKEVAILRQVFHPNVVLFLGACTKPGHQLMIVTELMRGDVEGLIHPSAANSGGPDGLQNRQQSIGCTLANSPMELDGSVQQQHLPSLHQRIRMAYDAALGINWLHGISKIVHRDLKPANLLLDESGHVKVTDFGFSEIIRRGEDESGGVAHNKDVKGPKGTALYMAPEVMRLEEFGPSSDVYSFGMILYEMASGKEPYEEYTELTPFVQAVCHRHERPVVPESAKLPASLVDLMKRCWDPTPSARPSFSEIVACLEAILVEVEIAAEAARAFWRHNFTNPLRETVAFVAELAPALASAHSMPVARVLPLERLMVGEKQYADHGLTSGFVPSVSMERFNQLYLWFGDWFDPVHSHCFGEMEGVASAPWFHNDISLNESVSRLRFRPPGTFMLRLSFKDPRAPYTLSLMAPDGQFDHKRVYRLTHGDDPKLLRFALQVGNTTQYKKFCSLDDIIRDLHESGVVTDPCPKSRVEVNYS